MKKLNYTLALIIGTLLFLFSYKVDQQINLFFKSARFQFLDAILSTITNFGIIFIVMLVIPSFILYKKNKRVVYILLLTFFISFVFALIIKLIVLRQRPIEAFTYPFVGIIRYSFPSLHATAAFSLLPILTEYLQKQKHFWLGFALLASFSRIYFGYHFLSDVVFGALFGYFLGDWLLELYEKKKLWK